MRARMFATLGTLLGTLSLAQPALAQDASGPTFTPGAQSAPQANTAASPVTFTPGGTRPGASGVSFSPANVPPTTPYRMDPCMASMPIPVTGHVGPDGSWHTSSAPPVVVGGGPGSRCETHRDAPVVANARTAPTETPAESATPSPRAGAIDAPADPWANSQAETATTVTAPAAVHPATEYDEGNPYHSGSPSATAEPAQQHPTTAATSRDDEANPYRGQGTASPLPPQSAQGGGPSPQTQVPLE